MGFLPGFGGAQFSGLKAAPSITYLGQTTGDGTGSTSESVTLDLGTAKPMSKIVVGIAHALWSGGGSVVSSANFNGSVNLVDTGVFRQGSDEIVEFFYYDDVSGAISGSTTINFSFSSAQAVLSVMAWRLTGAASGGPALSATSAGNPSGTLSLATLSNDMVVGLSFQRANSDFSMTWTGLTEDFEAFPTSQYNVTSAAKLMTAYSASETITAAWSSSGVRAPVAISASFRPDFGVDGSTLALFHFDGTDAATFIPDYTNKNTVSVFGNAQLDTAQSVFGGSSLLLDGTGDYLNLASRSEFGIGTGEFCIEARVRFNSLSSRSYIMSQGSSSNFLSLDHDAAGNLRCVVGGTAYTFAWSPSTATWYHVAVSRQGTNLRAFVDGTQIGTTQTCSDSISAEAVKIGARYDAASALNGWLDEFRYSNVSRFTSNFTPPAQQYGI